MKPIDLYLNNLDIMITMNVCMFEQHGTCLLYKKLIPAVKFIKSDMLNSEKTLFI